ncbi:hypothetical protein PHISCL_11153, partial [Aspergillus sclerotialis]
RRGERSDFLRRYGRGAPFQAASRLSDGATWDAGSGPRPQYVAGRPLQLAYVEGGCNLLCVV